MATYAGVKLEYDPLVRYVKKNSVELQKGTVCIISTEFGEDSAVVTMPDLKETPRKTEHTVLRIASKNDFDRIHKNQAEGISALKIIKDKVEKHKLPMKILKAHFLYDRSKILFFFTAENRVDFRNLVKDLANIFRTRIELRQIGARDATRMGGGIGPCGLVLCCHKFKVNFDPISIKCAKDQHLSLNTNKLSGLCNRLHCCLTYENSFYQQMSKKFPKNGSMVLVNREAVTSQTGKEISGEKKELKAKVRDSNIPKGTVLVELETEAIMEVPVNTVRQERKIL